MRFRLAKGTLDGNPNMDGWVITSDKAQVHNHKLGYLNCFDDDCLRLLNLHLIKGDRIDLDGDVFRGDEHLGHI